MRIPLLYIVRHGKAKPDSDTGRDWDRELRNKGRRQARWLGAEIGSRPDAPAVLLSSEAVRARQTAECIGHELDLDPTYVDALALGSAVSDVVELLEDCPVSEPIMVVGHNPTLECLASFLISGSFDGVRLRTGECAIVARDGDRWHLIETLRFEEEL